MEQFYENDVGIINYEADTNDKCGVLDKTVTFLPYKDINIANGK
jgi:hypothetical protein